jgi:hypothetical protein
VRDTDDFPPGIDGMSKRLPIGSCFGQSRAAIVSLTMATCFDAAESCSVKARPWTIGRRIMSKYVAVTLLHPIGAGG